MIIIRIILCLCGCVFCYTWTLPDFEFVPSNIPKVVSDTNHEGCRVCVLKNNRKYGCPACPDQAEFEFVPSVLPKVESDTNQAGCLDQAGKSEMTMQVHTEDEALINRSDPLPCKSREKYLKCYENFMTWREEKKLKSFSEKVFMMYFMEMAKSKKPNTLWCYYSMLKGTLNEKHDVRINTYPKLLSFLKKMGYGIRVKKSKILTAENIETFLNNAPDFHCLALKVALIFGINGACRANELVNMTVDDIQKHSDKLLFVTLPDTQSKTKRLFAVRDNNVQIVEKYLALRPKDMATNRVFINYKNGKCIKQVFGKNKISGFAKEIATYLQLPNPEMYTGRCFRKTSAALIDYKEDLTAQLSGAQQ